MDGEFGYHDLERYALAFVLETETWPVFLEWAGRHHPSEAAGDWLERGPDLDAARRGWLRHSPDPGVRALGG